MLVLSERLGCDVYLLNTYYGTVRSGVVVFGALLVFRYAKIIDGCVGLGRKEEEEGLKTQGIFGDTRN